MAFEVASVRPSGNACRGTRSIDAQQVRYNNFSLKGLVKDAYKVEMYQIKAPEWLDDQCYDVLANLPAGASKEHIPAMLQTLLAERFHMKVHRETRQGRVYALLAGKSGSRLKELKEGMEKPTAVEIHRGSVEFTSATLDSFASAMSTLLAHPVVNMTEIQGRFDITLNVSMEDLAGIRLPPDGVGTDTLPESQASSSVFAAMKDLGLRLDSRNAPIERIVVESAEKIPTGN